MAAAQMAYRLGGGAWLLGYLEGDAQIIKALTGNWATLKGFFSAPQPDAPLTKMQLLEVVAMIMPKES